MERLFRYIFLLCLIKSTPSNYKTDNEFIRNRYSFVINKVLENEEAIKNKFYKYFTQYDDIDIYPIIGEKIEKKMETHALKKEDTIKLCRIFITKQI